MIGVTRVRCPFCTACARVSPYGTMKNAASDFGTGIVYIVGSGPGDPGLITARGLDLIARADAIVFDSSVNRSLIPPTARDSGFPELYFVGRRRKDKHRVTRQQIQDLLIRLARDGKRVVRLTGGDPYVFGLGSHEAQALYDASVPFEVVPGITAGIAAVSYAGIPVTHDGLGASVTFVSGNEVPGRKAIQTDWNALAKAGGTIVIYMGIKSVSAITAALLDGGMPEEIPAAAVERGTQRTQRTVTATLATIAETLRVSGVTGSTIMIIGWPVILREEMSWFENRPLFGKRLVVGDSGPLADAIAGRLSEKGAEVLRLTPGTVARVDLSALRAELDQLTNYQWIVFSTRDAVTIFWEQLLGGGRDSRALSGLSIAAIGAETAGALLEHGIAVDVIPPRFTEESLLEEMREREDIAGSRVLVVSPESSADAVAEDLSEQGAEVTAVGVYRSVPVERAIAKLRRSLDRRAADAVVLLSASAVKAYVAAVGEGRMSAAPAATIGAHVTESASEAGISLLCEASEPTTDSLESAIERALT